MSLLAHIKQQTLNFIVKNYIIFIIICENLYYILAHSYAKRTLWKIYDMATFRKEVLI